MPSRAEILRKIFKEGLKSVDTKTLKKLFASLSEEKKIYRYEGNPKRLLEKGFEIEHPRLRKFPREYGLYWSPTPEGVTAHTGKVPNVEGIRRPGRKVRSWGYGINEDKYAELPIESKGAADFVYGMSDELAQLRPNNVLAKIRIKDKDFYRILAISGLLGVPKESERSVK